MEVNINLEKNAMKTILFLLFPLITFSQNEEYEKLKKLPKIEFEKAFNDSIEKLKSNDLWNFIYGAKENKIDIIEFNHTFIKRLENADWLNEIAFLTEILIEQLTEKKIIEYLLNKKKEIWDKGEWSEKFWKIIRKNNYDITENTNYTINEKGEKTYNLKLFFQEKTRVDEIGQNPLLSLNHKIVDYPENKLLETLEKFIIKDIQIIPKVQSVGLFGKRGIDGMINILTK